MRFEIRRETIGFALVVTAGVVFFGSTISSCSSEGGNSADSRQVDNNLPIDSALGAPEFDTSLHIDSLLTFDSFVDTDPELIEATVFLVKKYDPGLCFGMPSPVPDEVVTRVLSMNPRLVIFVRKNFIVNSDFQVFVKIRQMFMTKVRTLNRGEIEYYLMSGMCCDIFRIHGKLVRRNGELFDSLLNRAVKSVPC